MSHTYQQRGTRIGELVDQKNAAYGSSFSKAGEFLRLLYPQGLRPEQMTDALLLVRIFDKQVRIATDADAFGESPFDDIAGYGLLGAQLHQERAAAWQDSANGPDATTQPKAQPASAQQPTRPQTTPNKSESNEPATSPNGNASPASSSEPASTSTSSALAPTAPAPASVSAADLEPTTPLEGIALRGLANSSIPLSLKAWLSCIQDLAPVRLSDLESVSDRLVQRGYINTIPRDELWYGVTNKGAAWVRGYSL